MSIIALIPARSQSKRIPNKNVYPLNMHPLMAYTIRAAQDSGVFDRVVVSTESRRYALIAEYYGAEVVMRPDKYATDTSPDIEWVYFTLNMLLHCDAFSILRPTSPFRTSETIKRAWLQFQNAENTDSIRAVELCSQHPDKMWQIDGDYLKPLIESSSHSKPYQSLPTIYAQNASLEMAWSYVVFENNSISGDRIKPFFTQEYEGFDINRPYDLHEAEWLIETKQVKLPDLGKPYREDD